MAEMRPTRRLDVALVEERLAETRARAQALIVGGGVLVNGRAVTKPGAQVCADATLSLAHPPLPYASRGGLKLAAALDRFAVPIEGRVALDVGASTGGFTDVLLKRGAARVYAVDVGYGQLAWSLRQDPRVIVMERTNVRHLQALPEAPDLVVADVSFISLRLVLPPVENLVAEPADAVLLIKPQFEAGKGKVGRKGVVRDPAIWREVLLDVLGFAAGRGWRLRGVDLSPITGPAGNVEFLTHLGRGPANGGIGIQDAVESVVAAATSRESPSPRPR